jgi:hypothetical protein
MSGSVDTTPRRVIWAPLDPFFTVSLESARCGIKQSLRIFSDVWLDTNPPGVRDHG